MEEIAEITLLDKGTGDNFPDLETGKIDILQYLEYSSGSSTETLVEVTFDVTGRMDHASRLLAVNTQQMMAPLHAAAVMRMATTQGVAPTASAAVAFHNAQAQQRLMGIPFDHPQVRLPDSPPETDSGQTSAGSPSGSEASPYSPDFHPAYHSGHMQGSVIVAGGAGNAGTSQLGPQPGVILNVHGLEFNEYDPAIHLNLTGGQQSQINNGEFYANQATPNVQHSPYILPSVAHNNGYPISEPMSRKRQRVDNQCVKPEPSSPPVISGNEENVYYEETSHQSIKFSDHQPEVWHRMYDEYRREIGSLAMCIVADKGFNYIPSENAFVNQKKNHFQITVHFELRDRQVPKLLKTKNGALLPILYFEIDFYGIKVEMPTSIIKINQSAAERKPQQYVPEHFSIEPDKLTKVTVPRLHFGETTNNNMRKNNRPNPEQRYFNLVASFNAVVQNRDKIEKFVIIAQKSDRTIVRASNPGQFESSENETQWQRGFNNSIYHPGPVGIGTENPTATLTVAGNIHCTGNIIRPSDARLKTNIVDLDKKKALEAILRLRIVNYEHKPDVVDELGLPDEVGVRRTGVLAQELERVMSNAVIDTGSYLAVNSEDIFYWSIAGIQEVATQMHQLFSKRHSIKRSDSGKSSIGSSTYSLNFNKSGSIFGDYMRCSHTSIAHKKERNEKNESKAYEAHKARGNHMPSTDYSRGRGLYSKRMIQLTIMILMMVIAFSVLAMVTLYAMDMYSRNSKNVTVIPHYVYPSPPSSSSLPSGPAQMSRTGTTSGSYRLPPELNRCNHLHCMKFCCGDLSYSANMLSIDKHVTSTDNEDIDGAELVLDARNSRAVHLFLVAQNSPIVGSKYEDLSDDPPKLLDLASPGDPKTAYSVAHSSTSMNLHTIRLLGSDNITLDYRYCMADDCSDTKRGNYTFYIPVSSSMPHIPTSVKFEIEMEDQVALCRHDTGQTCSGLDSSVLTNGSLRTLQRSTTVWELPVGYFLDSVYTFRIGESTTFCSMPDDESGASFIEYTLWFYRLCK